MSEQNPFLFKRDLFTPSFSPYHAGLIRVRA